jgi:hypothetical protein
MVVSERNGQPILYVGNGSSLHWYARPSGGGKPVWDSNSHHIPSPGGNIKALAATNTWLYALTGATLKRISSTSPTWDTLSISFSNLQTIYTAGGPGSYRVFVGARRTDVNIYDMYELNEGPASLTQLRTDTGMLTGAAFDGTNYYVSTTRHLYNISTGSVSPQDEFWGILNLEQSAPFIAAIAGQGKLYNAITNSQVQYMNKYVTGAFCVWRDPAATDLAIKAGNAPPPPRLILAGIQESLSEGYTYGYREFLLNDSGTPVSFHEPGKNSVTSALDNSRYTSTIGKHSISHIMQVPYEIDTAMPLFAATSKNGLWSCRNRQWNAEE